MDAEVGAKPTGMGRAAYPDSPTAPLPEPPERDVLATLEPRPAVLVVTHDTGFLRHVDQVIRMESGRVVERPGSADEPVRSGNEFSSSVPRARLTN